MSMVINLVEDHNIYLCEGGPVYNGGVQPTPITYLTQWKIVGNSEVHGNEIWSCGELITKSLILFDGTQELSEGWLPISGEYPTTNISYPNAKYYVFDVKAGYTITTTITSNIRLRILNNGSVVNNIQSGTNNEYVKSTYDPIGQTTGYVVVKQDCKIGLLILDSNQSYEGSIVASYIKYHILVQPLGGSIADIVLDEPLRKVNDVADTIEFPSGTEGKALVTRNLKSYKLANLVWAPHLYNDKCGYSTNSLKGILVPPINSLTTNWNAMCNRYSIFSASYAYDLSKECIGCDQNGYISIADYNYIGADDFEAFKTSLQENDTELIITLIYPTTELVDAPQIEEADSYSMVISQGGKAVGWSSFETE